MTPPKEALTRRAFVTKAGAVGAALGASPVLATTAKGNRVILLHGFQKKSHKTPRQDMEIAQQRQKRYFQRHGYL